MGLFSKILEDTLKIVAIFLAIAITVSSFRWMAQNTEIEPSEYNEIAQEVEEHPELKPEVAKSMSDGKITKQERHRLFPNCEQIEPIERLKRILK